MKRHHHRHLPHLIPEGHPIFLTWNLKGALPANVHERLLEYRTKLELEALRQGESQTQRAHRHAKLVFAWMDEQMGQATTGPMYLREPAAAEIVEDAILAGASDEYDLFAWCVMANHVHVLLTPHHDLSKITQRLKGGTAFRINGLHDARGRVFWQDESYDHWARDDEETGRIIAYIENNPVTAGLCKASSDWLWSSARRRSHWPRGTAFRPETSVG